MEDPGKVESIFRAEWVAISSAPFSFLGALSVLLALGWLIIWRMLGWRYVKLIEIKDMVIKLQDERIAIKDEEIAALKSVDQTSNGQTRE